MNLVHAQISNHLKRISYLVIIWFGNLCLYLDWEYNIILKLKHSCVFCSRKWLLTRWPSYTLKIWSRWIQEEFSGLILSTHLLQDLTLFALFWNSFFLTSMTLYFIYSNSCLFLLSLSPLKFLFHPSFFQRPTIGLSPPLLSIHHRLTTCHNVTSFPWHQIFISNSNLY